MNEGNAKHKYGSLLKSHPDVKEQSQKYPMTYPAAWWTESFNQRYKKLPDSFDGRNIWEAYIQFPSEQKSAESWAIVATDILADRYTIITAGQINLFLSFTELIACINPPQHLNLENPDSSYIDATQGYSIYDAWEYIYKYGVPETNCFSRRKLKNSLKKVYPNDAKKQVLPSDLTYMEKQDIYGKKCLNIEGNQLFCLTMQDNKPIARRTFFCDGIFNILADTLHEIVDNIKYEILRFGPVAAGFVIYENFANGYDGISIYTGPLLSDKPLGGHYVSIIGWGNKDDKNEIVPEYWICRNSWGTNWGLLGFFKIQIGILECQLEYNVSACAPFYHYLKKTQYMTNDGYFKGKQVDITDMEMYNPELVKKRAIYDIDESNFYPKKAVEMIKKGELYGDLDPLISFPKDLPNLKYYWAENFRNFKVITEEQDGGGDGNGDGGGDNKHVLRYIIICILFVASFYIGYRFQK